MKKIIIGILVVFFMLITVGCQVPSGPNNNGNQNNDNVNNDNNNNENDENEKEEPEVEDKVECKITVTLPEKMLVSKEYLIEPVTEGDEDDTYVYEISNSDVVELNGNVLLPKAEGTFDLTIKSVNDSQQQLVLTIEIVDNRIFRIVYYKSGGTLEDPISTFTVKDLVVLPIPTRDGYIFGGWYLTENLSGDAIVEIDGKIASNVAVYAKWIYDDGSTEESDATYEMIKNLPLVINITHKEQVEAARLAYDALSDKEKSLITNYQKLLNAENRIKIEIAKYQLVVDLINLIPDNVTLSSSSKIIDAEEAYEKLSDLYRPFVTNYQKLVDARKVLNELLDNVDFNINDYIPEYIDGDIYAPSVLGTKKLTWSIMDSLVLEHSNEYFKINKIYQNHQEQKATVSVVVDDGVDQVKLTKEVIIAPIVYENFTSTPVAAYVNSGAMYHYVQYNGRDEVFSNNSKEVLDIVYYCFVNPTSNGGVTISDAFKKYYNDVIALKNSGVRVVVSVAGSTQVFSDVCYSDSLREKFAQALVDVVVEYNFDGIDLDWEFPGTGNRDTSIDKANYTKLFKTLREKLDSIQDANGSNYLLSSAVPSTSWGTNRYDFPGMNKYLDYVNMMSYDLNRTDKTTHISPLYTSNKDGGYGFSVQYGINRFTSLGLDKSKIIIGVACYGKSYKVTGSVSSSSTLPGLGVTGSLTLIDGVIGSHASGTLYYYGIEQLIKTGKYTKYIETLSNGNICSSYLYNATDKIFISYESPEVIAAKYRFALDNGIGIMCWSMPEDASDVYINTIYDIKYEE